MTKSNNEWVPEVGDEFEFKQPQQDSLMWKQSVARYVGDNLIIGYHEDLEWAISIGCNIFRQIKTEAEKRREFLRVDLGNSLSMAGFIGSHTDDARLDKLIDSGWIKPKPLTDDVISKLHHPNSKVFAARIESYVHGELD